VSEERKGRRGHPAQPASDAAAEAPVPAADTAAPAPAEPAAASPVPPPEDAALFKDRWLRAEAELQNYRRRAAREREEARRGAEESVMLELIAALDDLDRALGALPAAGTPEPWAEGVRLVASRLTDFLARQGVVAQDPLGQPFDPAFHEAVLEMAVPGVEPGRVTQVLLKGWSRGPRALRAARVVVARAPGGEA
jgi:molecular chaperone GrpE